jgi:hypothetical protein
VAFTEINEPGVNRGADVAGDDGPTVAVAVAGLVAMLVAVPVTEPGLVAVGAVVGERGGLACVVATCPAEVLAVE